MRVGTYSPKALKNSKEVILRVSPTNKGTSYHFITDSPRLGISALARPSQSQAPDFVLFNGKIFTNRIDLELKSPDPAWPEMKAAITAAVLKAPKGTFIYSEMAWKIFRDPSVNRHTLDNYSTKIVDAEVIDLARFAVAFCVEGMRGVADQLGL